MLIDIGVNLTGSAFARDLEQVISRAQQVGVEKMMVTGTDVVHSRSALQLSQQYPEVLYATAGIHPHHASTWDEHSSLVLQTLAQQAAVVAIGECGLDFNRNYSPADAQRKCFEAQLELAADLGLPVFLHQRDAHDEFIAILRRWRDKLEAAVVHCFTGSEDEARAYGELDMYIGITGWICDERRGTSLQRAVKHIAEDRLMVETDAPYLLPRDLDPQPKDRRNEPMYLPHVCRALAHYRDQDQETMAQLTSRNAIRFFKLG